MSEKQVKQIIHSLAEQKAPESSIDLWPDIKSQVSSPILNRHSKLRFAFAILGLSVLLAGVVFFLTPQGQAWAQDAFQFFTQTETLDSVSQGVTIQDDTTPTPDQDDQTLEGLTLEEVQALADFQIYQPAWLPEDFTFAKAFYDKANNIVTLQYYRLEYYANAFGLRQTPLSSSESCELCSLVGSNARVHEVSINGIYGEYVRGVWTGEEGYDVWENDMWMQTMIWQDCGMAFELIYMGSPGYLTKLDMIAIAESIQ